MPSFQARVATPVSGPTPYTTISKISSALLRLLSYLFLRWALIPLFHAIIFTIFAVYVPSFVLAFINESSDELVDDIDITATTNTFEEPTDEPNTNGHAIEASEVVVDEYLTTQSKQLGAWWTLITGAPNPRSIVRSALPLVVNAIIVGMVADRVFSESKYNTDDLSFVRLGYVSDTEAKLLIREPDQSKMPVTVQIHVKDPQPPFDNPQWQTAGGVKWTSIETDFTAVIMVPLRLSRQRIYEWKSSNNHSGEFTTPPRTGRVSDVSGGQFTFLSTSCITQRLPYSPFDHPLSIPGMRHLAKVLPSLNAHFMLFLGDFIYIDVPSWRGKEVSHYREKYRQVYASPEWQLVGQNLSWIHVLDDHEIANDWSHNTTGVYQAAIEPWMRYQGVLNPPLAKQAGSLTTARPDATYYEFSQGPASFFLLDTRTYRSSNGIVFNDTQKSMLGTNQLEDLLAFLARPEPRGVKWKIIASSVPFTKNWHVNTKDTWGGFLVERQKVLEAMWDVGSRGIGVVVLSGDRHEFAATKFPPPTGSKWSESATVYEFSASPLSQFYSPFPSYKQTDGEDVLMKYINQGNSKFGAITIESHEQGKQSSLKYRLFVDGVETWSTVVLSSLAPSEERTETSGSLWDKILGN